MNKDIWDDLGRAVTGAADAVSRKAGEIVEITRLKNQIYSLEREIRRDYEALGKIVYERKKARPKRNLSPFVRKLPAGRF